MQRYSPLLELILVRTREFIREPEAIFWVYCFPFLLMGGLAVAFRGEREKLVVVDLIESEEAARLHKSLEGKAGFQVRQVPRAEALQRHAAGKTDLFVEASGGKLVYTFDPTRDGAVEAKLRVNEALQEQLGRTGGAPVEEQRITEPGSRYIDWLIPGILGMNIMGGGMWGLGFVTVDLRMRKLLKRFVATPLRRRDFLLSLVVSRLFFLIPEAAAILAVGHWVFGLTPRGSLLDVAVLALAGSAAFSGIGLLVACRTDKMETISGLMNAVMLPMWILSGIFFSADRFPPAMQPIVQSLPLTQLNNALRAVILEGSSLQEVWLPVGVLLAYGVVAFCAALRWFKWR